MLVAVAFITGLALGFTLGLAAYFGTYTVFFKWHEERTRVRIIRAEQVAARRAQELTNLRHKMRSLRGDMLDSPQEITDEVEQALGAGPGSGER